MRNKLLKNGVDSVTGSKWLKAIVVIAAAMFFVHQIYVSFFNVLTTSAAMYYEHMAGIETTGLMIRDEVLVNNNSSGIMHYTLKDGEKVSKGGVIAEIYDSQSTSLAISQINQLENQLEDIKEIQGYNDISAVDLELCNHKVNTALYEYVNKCSTGRFDGSEEYSNELLSALNRRQYATGEANGFEAVAASLTAQIETLKTKVTAPKQNIVADRSGYFVSNVDGYETTLNTQIIQNITPEYISSINADEINQAEHIGKIVSNYKWYIAASLPLKDAQKLKLGESAKLKINLPNVQHITATVLKISTADDEKNCAVVFECYDTNSSLATIRTCPITIVTEEYKGLKVSNKALRNVDGQVGVYIVRGLQIKYVTAKVIYQTSSFAICDIQNESSGGLRLYDEVVEKGRNLYDGKLID